MTTIPSWGPDAVATDDLLAGLKAARTLQQVPVPLWLSKRLANYSLRAATALASRLDDIERLVRAVGREWLAKEGHAPYKCRRR